ncbi:MAG: hypothetical protein ABSG89_05740 [Bacteroidales bacterium]|jgi:hypothetical protein
MKPGTLIASAIIGIVLVSCTKRNSSEFTDIPIIQGYIRPGACISLTVSRQIPFSTDVTYSSDDINNLKITVKYDSVDYIMTPLGGGHYTDSSLIAVTGGRYDLSFTYNSKTVTAYTTIPSKPVDFTESDTLISVMRMDSTTTYSPGTWTMPNPVLLTWENPDNSYYIVVVENMEAVLDPVRQTSDTTSNEPYGRFNKAPTTASGIELRAQEFTYFGHDRLILYHVLPDYASLYNQASNSSQDLTNPSTSITNGYGIFTGLNSDTLYFFVAQASSK